MKKILSVLSLCMIVGIISGCGDKKERTISCDLSQTLAAYELKSNYKIYATGDVVNKVETVETVTSSDESILDTFETSLNTQYETANKTYGGYTYKITNSDSKVESKVTIDYSKVDMDKMIKDNTAMKSYVNGKNRLTVDGALKIYEALGAVCEK